MNEIPEDVTALVILVPEVEPWVARFRATHDPSAAAGMPAHITLLYPFVPQRSLDESARESLRSLSASFQAWAYRLRAMRRWPDVLYLEPVPSEPFRQLTRALVAQFPAYPPYGGLHPDPTPHLTIGHAPPEALDALEAEVHQAIGDRLPLPAKAGAVALMGLEAGRWRQIQDFPLKPTGQA